MKFLQILILVFVAISIAEAQNPENTLYLNGSVHDSVKNVKSKIRISGLTEDPFGALFPFVNVYFKDQYGTVYQTVSDENGEYTIELPLGTFNTSAEKEVESLLWKSKEIKIEICSFNDVKLGFNLLCTEKGKGKCPRVITYSCG